MVGVRLVSPGQGDPAAGAEGDPVPGQRQVFGLDEQVQGVFGDPVVRIGTAPRLASILATPGPRSLPNPDVAEWVLLLVGPAEYQSLMPIVF